MILNKIKLGKNELDRAQNLKLVCETATGYDNIDVACCERKNIAVSNVVGYSTDSVAQLTAALVLELVLHLKSYTDYVRSGDYTRSGVANKLFPAFCEMSGKTWGIVGMGNIGAKVAKIAEAFGCRVIYTRRSADKAAVSLDELMSEADIITVHLPLSEQTRGIIGREKIAMMKKSAVIVNVARGAVIDEEALCDAVENGRIAGAAADVYSKEPFDENHCYNRIMHMDNFVLTPHMAWGAVEARKRCMDEIYKNIEAFCAGNRRNRVDGI